MDPVPLVLLVDAALELGVLDQVPGPALVAILQ